MKNYFVNKDNSFFMVFLIEKRDSVNYANKILDIYSLFFTNCKAVSGSNRNTIKYDRTFL